MEWGSNHEPIIRRGRSIHSSRPTLRLNYSYIWPSNWINSTALLIVFGPAILILKCWIGRFFSASPQVASASVGDCAFEDDYCGWSNPERSARVDELNWDRVEVRASAIDDLSLGLSDSTSGVSGGAGGGVPQSDHTTGTKDG